MKNSEKILYVLLVLTIFCAAYFANNYFKIRGAMDSIKSERKTHRRITKSLREEIKDFKKGIEQLKLDKLKLNEKITIMLQDAKKFPDMEFLKSLAEKLKGTDTLVENSKFGQIYLGRPILCEKQRVDIFFIKKGIATFKFDPLNIISRAEFSMDNSKNLIIKQMSHKRVYVVNFIGEIASWDGRFQFKNCRITGIWDMGKRKDVPNSK